MKSIKMKRSYGFTLAEVLITLAIIGVVAALSIPAVISNSQQQEFKTGLRKAVSVLNSAITMNMALDGESPYDNANTFGYLQKHMSILKSTSRLPWISQYVAWNETTYASGGNAGFYTTDGMRFEIDDYRNENDSGGASMSSDLLKLHESDNQACLITDEEYGSEYMSCGGCGSYGLNHNPNNTTKVPCAILVDVNGDKKPYPSNVNCNNSSCANQNMLTAVKPDSKVISDIFTIMITDKEARPFGVVAQRAMYQAQK